MNEAPTSRPVHIRYRSPKPLLITAACCTAVWAASYFVWPRVTLLVAAGIAGVLTSLALHNAIQGRLRARFQRSDSDE